jgi:hypothetical protein
MIKGQNLVGIHKVYPLVDSDNLPAFVFGFWLLEKLENDKYYVLRFVI